MAEPTENGDERERTTGRAAAAVVAAARAVVRSWGDEHGWLRIDDALSDLEAALAALDAATPPRPDESEPPALAQRIKDRRIELGMTQEELARRAGLRLLAVGRIERGQQAPRRQTLLRLAAALETDPAALLETDHRDP